MWRRFFLCLNHIYSPVIVWPILFAYWAVRLNLTPTLSLSLCLRHVISRLHDDLFEYHKQCSKSHICASYICLVESLFVKNCTDSRRYHESSDLDPWRAISASASVQILLQETSRWCAWNHWNRHMQFTWLFCLPRHPCQKNPDISWESSVRIKYDGMSRVKKMAYSHC